MDSNSNNKTATNVEKQARPRGGTTKSIVNHAYRRPKFEKWREKPANDMSEVVLF